MNNKIIALTLSGMLIMPTWVQQVFAVPGGEDFGYFADFNELENVSDYGISLIGNNSNAEVDNGKLKITSGGNGVIREDGIKIGLDDTVTDDIIKLSFKLQKLEPVNAVMKIDGNDRAVMFHDSQYRKFCLARQDGTNCLNDSTAARIMEKGSGDYRTYDPFWGKEAEVSFTYDLKNKTVRVQVEGEDVDYMEGIIGLGSINTTNKISSNVDKISNFSVTFAPFTTGTSASITLDDIKVTSLITELNNEIKKLNQSSTDEEISALKARIDEYVELGYDKDMFLNPEEVLSGIFSTEYDIDYENKTVSGIKYNTPTDEFFENLLISEGFEAKIIRESAEVTNGVIEDGDKLLINGVEYTLNVLPPNNDVSIKSEVYDITDDVISGVDYGTKFSEFKENILIHELSEIEYGVYKPDYNGDIDFGFNLTVIAQSGDRKIYTVKIGEPVDYEIYITSEEFEVNNDTHEIFINDECEINDIYENVISENGERTELYTYKGTLKVTGKVNGGEILRVYKNNSLYNEFTDYVINRKTRFLTDMDHEAEGVTKLGGWRGVSAMAGLNGNTCVTNPGSNGTMTFKYVAEADGILKMSVMVGKHTDTAGEYDGITYKNGETEEQISLQITNHPTSSTDSYSGLDKLAEREVKYGDVIEIIMSGGGSALRIGGVRFEMEKQTKDIEDVLISKDKVEVITGDSIDASKTDKAGIKLYSENGTEIEVDIDLADGLITLKPNNQLKSGLIYNLYIAENTLKNTASLNVESAYTYQLKTEDDANNVITGRICYLDSEDYRISDIDGAKSMILEYKNVPENAKVCIVVFKNNKMIEKISGDVSGNGIFKATFDDTLDNNSKIKVFFLSEENVPLKIL